MKLARVIAPLALASPAVAAPAPQVMDGPFATLDDYCDALAARAPTEAAGRRRCEAPRLDDDVVIAAVDPYLEIAIVNTRDLDRYQQLALRLPSGWWIQVGGQSVGSDRSKADFAVTLDAHVVPEDRAPPRIVLRFATTRSFDPTAFDDLPGRGRVVDRWTDVVVCGLDRWTPACLPVRRGASVAAAARAWARRGAR